MPDAFMQAAELASAIRAGDTSSREATQAFLDRIARANPRLHAFVAVDADAALAQADAADAARRAGFPLGPLHGVPVAIKDLFEVAGQVVTVGSAAWRTRRATVTACAVERLRAAQMVVIGRTHMVEFAFGGWGVNPVMGTPRNPWDATTHRVPGGSSSGSGVAVAAGLAPAALGSDTGGSVRIPAALNGITGLKTTYGLVPLTGAFPLSFTLDTIGPMARSAHDCELLTSILAGPDPRDPASLLAPRFMANGDAVPGVRGMRVGLMVPDDYPMPVDAATQAAIDEAMGVLRGLGAIVSPLRLPFDLDDLMRRTGRIIAAEAWSTHRAYADDPAVPLGEHVRARLQGGRDASAVEYLELLAHQRQERARFAATMADHDVLVAPSVPWPATPLDAVDETSTPMGAFTRWGNYLGVCALSLPAGIDAAGLPLAVQVIGKPFDDARVLRVGRAFQSATDWHRRRPAIAELDP